MDKDNENQKCGGYGLIVILAVIISFSSYSEYKKEQIAKQKLLEETQPTWILLCKDYEDRQRNYRQNPSVEVDPWPFCQSEKWSEQKRPVKARSKR